MRNTHNPYFHTAVSSKLPCEIWIHRSHAHTVCEQDHWWLFPWNNLEKGRKFIKCSYTVSIVNRAYIVLVWCLHSIYCMKHSNYGVFNKYMTLSLVIGSLPLINLWPWTWVIYLSNTPTSHYSWFITTYIHHNYHYCLYHFLVIVAFLWLFLGALHLYKQL